MIVLIVVITGNVSSHLMTWLHGNSCTNSELLLSCVLNRLFSIIALRSPDRTELSLVLNKDLCLYL